MSCGAAIVARWWWLERALGRGMVGEVGDEVGSGGLARWRGGGRKAGGCDGGPPEVVGKSVAIMLDLNCAPRVTKPAKNCITSCSVADQGKPRILMVVLVAAGAPATPL